MSPLVAPNRPQIEHALDDLLGRNADALVLGLRSPTRQDWPEFIERSGRRFHIAWCISELEMRERLDGIGTGGAEGLIVLTPLNTAELGGDIAARLPRGRLEQSSSSEALARAFGARSVDSRLRNHRWLIDLLLERTPIGGYPPASGGALDLETAWRAMQERVLCLPEGRADASALLDWTTHNFAGLDRFMRLPEEARRGVIERIVVAGGPAAGLVLRVAAAGRGPDALAFGLVCGVVFGEAEPRLELREAAIRLEPWTGGIRIDPTAGSALGESARRVLNHLTDSEPALMREIQARAESLLVECRADGAAALSPALDLGLETRMRQAAAALRNAALSPRPANAGEAWTAFRAAHTHDRAKDHAARLERLRMAARLACWLATEPRPRAPSIAEASASYARDGSFVDCARHALKAGDALPELATAYAKLRDAAVERREAENHVFAELVGAWNAAGAAGADPIPVEAALNTLVAPIARQVPVLVLVLDGLSFAVWRSLAGTITRLGWTEFRQIGQATPPTAIAVMPSVTNVSRVSLLCGTLARGDQATERAGFASHPGLVAASRPDRPPRLFHKADLRNGPEIKESVRDAIIDPEQRVVGIVHNAVDDQLSGSDQIDLVWSAEGMRQVSALLRLARDVGRLVVVVSDHGHVIDEGTVANRDGAGERWRASGPASEGEIALTGGRVLTPNGSKTIVAPWSEGIRYAGPSRGYHGGISPQELLIPIAVLGADTPPQGWEVTPPAEPAWWCGLAEDTSLSVRGPIADRPTPRRRPADTRQPELFGAMTAPTHSASSPPPTAAPSWIDRLLASDSYATQRRLAGRVSPPDEQVRPLLIALAARGGRLSQAGLALALATPAFRVGGLVSAVRRVLNLDQAQVLAMDGDDIVLDQRLLRRQFDLGDAP
ncbi:MAG: BREX-2 system phosphatase PglZ [Aliidongia sp.]